GRDAAVQPDLPFIDQPGDAADPPVAADEIKVEPDEAVARPNPRDDGSLDLSRLKVPDFLLDRSRGGSEAANDRIEPALEGSRSVPDGPGGSVSDAPVPLPEEPALKASDIEPFPPGAPPADAEHDRKEAPPLASDGAGSAEGPVADRPAGLAITTESGLEPVIEPFTVPGRPATVIGTYNSGDNRYVMFSDGSIEAETPQGNFRFASLDELKAFIAAGGEGTPGPV
ncbi:MAG: hypothetical protein ABW026_14775, partial [Microvirga sp.]